MKQVLTLCGMMIFLPALLCAESIPLQVDFGTSELKVEYPVRGGFPLARGKLRSVKAIRLLSDKTAIPCQVKPLAFWPDKSLKWVCLDFMAQPGKKYAVELDEKGRQPSVSSPVKAKKKSDGSIEVDTGVLKFEISKNGSGFIDSLWFDANKDGKYADEEMLVKPGNDQRHFMNFICLDSRKSYRTGHDWWAKGKPDPSKVVITALEIEESGPIHAVVLIRGFYKYKLVGKMLEGEGIKHRHECKFTLRLHAYAGSGLLGCQHWYVYDGAPDYDIVRDIGLSLPLNVSDKMTILGPTAQERSLSAKDLSVASLFVEDADSSRIWGESSKDGAELVVETSKRPVTWLDASGPKYGITMAVRKGWQNHPKSLWVDRKNGKLTVYLWPPEAGMLDYRRYSRTWSTGETGARGAYDIESFSKYAAKGTSKTHDVLFYFHHADAAAQARQVAAAFDAFPLIQPGPEYWASTRALGFYRPYDTKHFATTEQQLNNIIEFYLDSQEKFRWFGMIDYGDLMWYYNEGPRNGRWACDLGRWAWFNGDDSGPVNWFLISYYVRTGKRRYFELGEAAVRHVQDVDVINTEEYPYDWGPFRNVSGCAHRHNIQHWGCPYVGARGGSPAGVRVLYYLTADGRMKDLLDRAARNAIDFQDGDKVRYGHSGGGVGAGAVSSQSLLAAWERTGDKKYIDYMISDFDNRVGVNRTTTGFGGMGALTEYWDLTQDTRVKDVIKRLTDPYFGEKKPRGRGKGLGPNTLELMACAWRIFKEEKYLDAVRASFEQSAKRIRGKAANAVPREFWPGRPSDPFARMESNTFRGIAFAMEALFLAGQGENAPETEKK